MGSVSRIAKKRAIDVVATRPSRMVRHAQKQQEILEKQRETLEILARNFEILNDGNLDYEAANVHACITRMLGTFRDLEEETYVLLTDAQDYAGEVAETAGGAS